MSSLQKYMTQCADLVRLDTVHPQTRKTSLTAEMLNISKTAYLPVRGEQKNSAKDTTTMPKRLSVDADLPQKDWEDLYLEVVKLRTAIRYHRDQKSDERCHLDDDKLYEVLPEGEVAVERTLPCNFLENCKQFFEHRQNREYKSVDELYAGWDKDKPYLSPAKAKLIVLLLEQASQDLSNNSCNELPIDNTDENWEIDVASRKLAFGDEDEVEKRPAKSEKIVVCDFSLCDYLVDQLKRMQ